MNNKIELVKYPDKKLKQKAEKVKDPSEKEIQIIIAKMADIMTRQRGIGLAGPQVGIFKQIVLIETAEGPLPLINPKITSFSKKTSEAEEGCLSVPETYGVVERSYSIKLKARAMNGDKLNFKADGLFARVLQHEIDHLNGIVFIDRVNKFTKNPHNYPLPI